MMLAGIVEDCIDALEHDRDAYVVYKIPRIARGCRIRITPKAGPLGEVVEIGQDYTVARFKASEVLEWLAGLGDGDARHV
ncbi:hypothetical protein IW967_11530 [Alicyclobacillus mali]|uniref:Uncharacterized protein n=1 Tax=Alicyclobacillus mali (ex Roth et al. 2021) TaxID=1123961 RepID=A0ABS0F5A1_9BACL|nr:hypothetical protein [Alicyclobacillus mali (ex Roth et al. 2021)]MBF8378485.1 hypothetical protein [Alicyclobacillus mali (ex Roth et al. 2021)]